MRSPRIAAFSKPLANWQPRIGEQVFVRSKRGCLSYCRSVGTIAEATLFPGHFRVLIERGSHRTISAWTVDDLRPNPKKIT